NSYGLSSKIMKEEKARLSGEDTREGMTAIISIKQMASVGFWVNLISATIIILVVYYVMPIVLGIDINQPLPLK
ncbi:hypothetical protein, partial [Staphylococcus aureus]|uniref:hypothetical protein n=1 Tax=Staphylococcus aureus TaxID=1280 RepID=UPI0021091D92